MADIPSHAMVFAAGLGTRMRPLTLDRPKALVEVDGRTLIDHMLDRLGEAGVGYAVVNAFHFADKLVSHLANRAGKSPTIIISREDALPEPLETEGGLIHAMAHLPEGPILTCNADAIWLDDHAIQRLADAYDPARMDGLLLLARLDQSQGFDGPGDFFIDQDGRLTPRGSAPSAPYAYAGVQITNAALFRDKPATKRSLARTWFDDWCPKGRLFGLVLDGPWLHIGDPQARLGAEQALREHRGLG
ncbi:nucleotidyltransferase family protein [Candidatus Phycosocius spiralis]|uniref:Mannose-1-phosphate guanylyltransferase n=1 Tax=Candidatus Phycosocius spiralis TaxID=2815099 RepID=A0ABQ4PTP6_9PROT|nr:nucleotidyltransferase family protein [Candidatus Phycosocius spiralis]GIU66397.1 mannose-1-phosphate guanylyltransferase [Candidatus Phycosocius spiralis]